MMINNDAELWASAGAAGAHSILNDVMDGGDDVLIAEEPSREPHARS